MLQIDESTYSVTFTFQAVDEDGTTYTAIALCTAGALKPQWSPAATIIECWMGDNSQGLLTYLFGMGVDISMVYEDRLRDAAMDLLERNMKYHIPFSWD